MPKFPKVVFQKTWKFSLGILQKKDAKVSITFQSFKFFLQNCLTRTRNKLEKTTSHLMNFIFLTLYGSFPENIYLFIFDFMLKSNASFLDGGVRFQNNLQTRI